MSLPKNEQRKTIQRVSFNKDQIEDLRAICDHSEFIRSARVVADLAAEIKPRPHEAKKKRQPHEVRKELARFKSQMLGLSDEAKTALMKAQYAHVRVRTPSQTLLYEDFLRTVEEGMDHVVYRGPNPRCMVGFFASLAFRQHGLPVDPRSSGPFVGFLDIIKEASKADFDPRTLAYDIRNGSCGEFLL